MKRLRALWQQRTRGDDGLTLVELLVAMALLLVVMASFFVLYGILSGAASNVVPFSQEQGTVRNVMRALEADLRSADPLVLVPSSFTADPNGVTNPGPSGTGPTDVVAMYEEKDSFSPCGSSSTTTTTTVASSTTTQPSVPQSYVAGPTSANVIWAFDPTTQILTRYSYCASGLSSGWVAGISLPNLRNSSGTMFQVAQDNTSSTQITTPTSTTVPNQAAPVCGTSITVVITVKTKQEQTPFRARVVVPLTNQPAVAAQAC